MTQTANTQAATLASFFHDLAVFNQWTAHKLAEWLKDKPEELMEKEVASSFPSLKATVHHIYFVEKGWLETLKGGTMDRDGYHNGFSGSMPELLEAFTKNSDALAEYVKSLDDKSIQEPCGFQAPVRWPIWDDFSKPRFELLQHCITHATYHRGQLITIARNLGITDPPMTDYMAYFLTAKDSFAA